ncbi:helix-turn-helix domain-containing protein [Epilithonimonas sp. UC225_85]|uniref:helix-turn-helix domain-containing protein n=1 Tax=Epilithonimonas sp. UC225_85 TaxID=3350167 RepID=UPI0036D3F786
MLRRKRGDLTPRQSSIVLNLKPIMTARQVIFPHAFLRKICISSNSVNKMLNGEAVQVNFRQLTAMCLALNCTPNDLFSLLDMQQHLSENHQLHKLQDINSPIIGLQDFYKDKSLEDIRKMNEH